MEPFALFQILKSLLPTEGNLGGNSSGLQEEKNSVSTENTNGAETEKPTDLGQEQRNDSTNFKRNAFLQFAAAHDERAKRTKK